MWDESDLCFLSVALDQPVRHSVSPSTEQGPAMATLASAGLKTDHDPRLTIEL